jgi:presqualene diphosphate synthase
MTAAIEGQVPAANRAKGSSFYLAMRILPRRQREAMFAVYSFCKAVDDIADGDAPRPWRLAQLADWRKRIAALYAGSVPAGLAELARAIAQYSLRQADFLTVIDGMEMDAAEDIRAPTFERLDLYCDCVASAVGRLSVRIFGLEDRDGVPLAHHLGRALQLTNILRDIDEDAAVGRLYLPHEALRHAGIESTEPEAVALDPRLGAACDLVVGRARQHFREADAVMARCPRRLVRAPRMMEQAYLRILEDMVQRGWAWPRNRVHVSRSHLLKIALRHAIL